MEQKILLECHKISKDFGITKALKEVDFNVPAGRVCGLVGENGSGKSTLAAVISGIYQATTGTMEYKGAPWKPRDVMDSQRGGISIIVQEAGTIGTLTVAENIFLGQEGQFRKGFMIDYRKMNAEAQKLIDEVGRYIDKYYEPVTDDIKMDQEMKSIFDKITKFRKKRAEVKALQEEENSPADESLPEEFDVSTMQKTKLKKGMSSTMPVNRNIDNLMNQLEETFSQRLLRMID